MTDYNDGDTPVEVNTLAAQHATTDAALAIAEEMAVDAPPDSAFEAVAEFEQEVTPVNLVCAHCGRPPLVLVKDTEQPPRTAEDAWKNGHCLTTRDRSLWSFCRTDGFLREHRAGAATCFDRPRQGRPPV